MPQVPRYQPDQVQETITPRVKSNVNVSREALGGGQSAAALGAVTSGAAEQAFKNELAARERVSDAEAFDGEQKISRFQNDLTNTIKSEFQGKKSVEAGKFADEKWQAETSKILEEYKDPVTKAKLSAITRQRYTELYKDVGNHSTTQLLGYEEGTYKSYVQNMRDEGIQNYSDPERLNRSLQSQQLAISAWAQHKGLSGEEMRQMLGESESKTHLGVITRMINENKDMLAKGYADKMSDKLVGQDKDTVLKLVESATLRGESQRKSDDIFSKSKDMTEAMDKTREIKDPELRDETSRRVKQRYDDQKAAERSSVEDLHIRATDVIDKTGDVDQIPREDWSRFSLSERSSLKSYAANRRKGTEPETSWSDYYDLKTLASTAKTKEKFMQLNLMTYRPKMADAEFKELVNIQKDLRSGKSVKELDGYRSKAMIVNDSLSAAGFDPTPKQGSKDAEKVAVFKSLVDEQIRLLQEQTGKEATKEDTQRISDNLLVQVVTKPGFIWDTKKRVFELDPQETGVIKVEDVPRLERRKIEEALRKKNLPVTDDKVLELYTRKLKGS